MAERAAEIAGKRPAVGRDSYCTLDHGGVWSRALAFDSEGVEDDLRRPLPPRGARICLLAASRRTLRLRFWATPRRLTPRSEPGSTEGGGGRRRLVFGSGLEDAHISAGPMTVLTVRVGAPR